jgi:peptidoglycan/LPS O-acetylase OafA/YrhL
VTEGQQRFFKPELDVLRFLAFLAVFLHHSLPNAKEGWSRTWPDRFSEWAAAAMTAGAFGVDLFFLLSAYLITTLLLREHRERGRIAVGSFYVRRALRIWPLYYVFLAITIWIVPLVMTREFLRPEYIVAFCLFAGNWICAKGGYPGSVAAPLWSVSIEEQFYLVWPLLLSWTGTRGLVPISGGVLALATGARLWLAAQHTGHPGVWCNTFAHLDPIAIGAILAVRFQDSEPTIGRGRRPVLFLSGAVAWMVAARFGALKGWDSVWTYPVVTLGSVAMLISFLGALPQGRRWPGFGALTHLGRVSYGLYVFHVLAIGLMWEQKSLGSLQVPAAFALTVVLALVSYQWLERPFLKLKERFAAVPSGRAL